MALDVGLLRMLDIIQIATQTRPGSERREIIGELLCCISANLRVIARHGRIRRIVLSKVRRISSYYPEFAIICEHISIELSHAPLCVMITHKNSSCFRKGTGVQKRLCWQHVKAVTQLRMALDRMRVFDTNLMNMIISFLLRA
jgi:hypothetical protein